METPHLHGLDYIVIIAYLAGTLLLSFRFHGKQKSTKDYFFGGGKMCWWAVAISLFATVFSAISFIAAPGEGYNHGMTMFIGNILALIPLPVGLYVFVRFFYELRVRTCNEYLEWRFAPVIRLISSIGFTVLRSVYLGVVLYATALVLRTVIGWPPYLSITIVGLFSLVFAYMGGMTSVVWTDVAQFFILFGGLLFVVLFCIWRVPGGVGGIWSYAVEHGHGFNISVESGFWRFDPKVRIAIWWWLLNMPLQVFATATDQMKLQRALSSGDFRAIGRTMWTYAGGAVPVIFLFYFAGISIFAYFRTVGAQTLPQDLNGDSAFNYFITTVLPLGMRGLLISGVLAAVISTVDSVLNSLSTVFVHDIYTPWIAPNRKPEHYLAMAKNSTLAFGVFTLVMGLLIVKVFDGGNFPLTEVSEVCLGLFGAFTGSFFILGLLAPRANTKGILCGMVMSIVIGCTITYAFYLSKPAGQRISFMFIGLGTNMVAIFSGLVASLFFEKPTEEQRKLVVWGMFRRIKDGTLPRYDTAEEEATAK